MSNEAIPVTGDADAESTVAATSGVPHHSADLPVRPDPTSRQRLAIPAYFEPGDEWNRLAAAAPATGLVVMNPDNGPGSAVAEPYVRVLATARLARVTTLGYVSTAHGARRNADITSDVARYFEWYGVDGIFFDETHVTGEQFLALYRPLYDHVKAHDPSSVVAMNPGTVVPECFMGASDILIDFEGSAEELLAVTFPSWRNRYEPTRFWHIVYSVDKELLEAVVRWSRRRRAGWLFLTDQPLRPADPESYLYDRLPESEFWTSLVRVLGG
jgi:hypothetical protein